jgi:hypothetical protein
MKREEMYRTTVMIPLAVLRALRAKARAEHRTLAACIRLILVLWANRQAKEPAADE